MKKRLRRCGYVMERQVGAHEQWRCSKTRKAVTLSIHGPTIRGDQVKSIYDQAGWAWRFGSDKPRKQRKKAAAPPKASISIRQRQPTAEEAVAYRRFTLDQRIEVVEMAMAKGDPEAAKHFGISIFCVAKWRGELGDADGSAPLREWKRRAKDAEEVERLAQLILGGQTANRLAHAYQLSLPTLYSIAHGTHRNLAPETADKLRKLWALRKDTNASGGATLGADKIAEAVDLIMEGMPVTEAGRRLGISQNLAFRIAQGRHRGLSDEQRDRLQHRPRAGEARQVNNERDMRMEIERLRSLLARERQTSEMLRMQLRGQVVASMELGESACVHGEVLGAIEAVADAEAERLNLPRREMQRRVAKAWVGQVCPRCRAPLGSVEAIVAQLWPASGPIASHRESKLRLGA